jgi:NADH-quinone oxidoreductase subunit K
MGLAAAEATLILAIVLIVVKRFKTSQAGEISEMKG